MIVKKASFLVIKPLARAKPIDKFNITILGIKITQFCNCFNRVIGLHTEFN